MDAAYMTMNQTQENLSDKGGIEMKKPELTVADIERIHVFLYAVKNNKQGCFTFTRLKDEQYQEVLDRFNKAKDYEQNKET